MTRQEPLGIFDLFKKGAKKGQLYKFVIETKDGKFLYKADPFANESELRPGTASRVTDITNLLWSDGEWMEKRKTYDTTCMPMSIYEVHPGSWKKHPTGSKETKGEDGFYTYRQLAVSLAKYVKDMTRRLRG